MPVTPCCHTRKVTPFFAYLPALGSVRFAMLRAVRYRVGNRHHCPLTGRVHRVVPSFQVLVLLCCEMCHLRREKKLSLTSRTHSSNAHLLSTLALCNHLGHATTQLAAGRRVASLQALTLGDWNFKNAPSPSFPLHQCTACE